MPKTVRCARCDRQFHVKTLSVPLFYLFYIPWTWHRLFCWLGDTRVVMAGCCETCGSDEELFVYALPGIPMSVGNCHNCLLACAYPLDVAKANTECIGGLEHAAEWWRDSITFVPGKGHTPVSVALGGD